MFPAGAVLNAHGRHYTGEAMPPAACRCMIHTHTAFQCMWARALSAPDIARTNTLRRATKGEHVHCRLLNRLIRFDRARKRITATRNQLETIKPCVLFVALFLVPFLGTRNGAAFVRIIVFL